MAEKAGYDQPPPYSQYTSDLSNKHGADVGTQTDGGAYPLEVRAYIEQGGALPQGYGQTHGQQTTTAVIDSQPAAAGPVVRRKNPHNYLLISFLVCLCCFWPTALCALHYAMLVKPAIAEGDMESAQRYSKYARNLAISSILIGVIVISVTVVIELHIINKYEDSLNSSFN